MLPLESMFVVLSVVLIVVLVAVGCELVYVWIKYVYCHFQFEGGKWNILCFAGCCSMLMLYRANYVKPQERKYYIFT